MNTVTTDYTNAIDTLLPSIFSEYRLVKYILGVLRNWAALPSNIYDARLISAFFDAAGKPIDSVCSIGTPFNPDSRWAGYTPSIVVSVLQGIAYDMHTVSLPGSAQLQALSNCALAPSLRKSVGLSVSVVTLSYDSTLLLALLISMYLLRNAYMIGLDCPMLLALSVSRVDAPAVADAQTQSKQVYGSTIHLQAVGYISWIVDTQGPVYRGITIKPSE